MTRKELRREIAELVWDTEVETTEEAWITQDEADHTAGKIMKLLSTVYNLEELVH